MAALTHQTSILLLFHTPHQPSTLPKPHLSLLSKPLKKPSFSLHSTALPHPSCPSDPIFLSLLNQPQEQEQEPEQEDVDLKEDADQAEEDFESTDPLLKFFESCTSTPTPRDPPDPGKFTLQSNRRSSWHLAPKFETDITTQNTEVGPAKRSNSRPLRDGVVGEILQIARGLPENVTLGESLGGFEGRVSETECVEVLGLMGEEEEEEGMLRCCLYFYEWMRLQEPPLVTPRACTVLFPVLGKAGMADELMVLFSNLPNKKEFRDVHVYNAAISGLLSCGRYDY